MELFNKNVYVGRRERLMKNNMSGIALFIGNTETPMNYPANGYHFRQDSTFLYFFGLDIPGLAAIIDFDEGKQIVFGNDVDIEDIIWMGPQPSIKDLAAKAGITETLPFAKLDAYIEKALSQKKTVHYLSPYRSENKMMLNEWLRIPFGELKTRSSAELARAVIALRAVKDEFEIVELEKAAKIGYDMHMAAFRMARHGLVEQEICGIMEGIALSGGKGPSFPIILSVRGETLHNHYHGNTMKDGDLLLSDAGAQSNMYYASDFTRTMPVSGKFTDKQKAIYQIVLDANNRALDLTQPGVTYQSIHLESAKVIASGLTALGLMKGNVDEAVAAGAHAMFFPHGLGHMMGLDVHDMEDLGENLVGYDDEVQRIDQFGTAYLRMGRRLQPGFVMTDEPGIYFIPALIDQWKAEKKFESFINYAEVEKYRGFGGIRLEDDILVTETGGRFIGKRLPITVAEVEEAMKK
ncbi:MAG: Xaa-Pro aminopeptidase [Bacteroidetes bacterium HGW-Bacteroidetes-6]|jgi:Xaa-Pro aminopeptidase|nr:MAG: Xaa-Pro aminopeptidase [Bacteroidetes bacterium HGW-Bacteroidetes-6]